MLPFPMIPQKTERLSGVSRPAVRPDATLLLLVSTAVLISIAAVLVFERPLAHLSPFGIPFLVGPTAKSLLEGKGLAVCTDAMGTFGNPICFHGARMPIPSATIALGVALFGQRYLAVALFKALLFLIPLLLAVWRVWACRPVDPGRRRMVAILLLLPFAATPFLADIVNLQVEEGYSYSIVAFAIARLFFRTDRTDTIEGHRHSGLIDALLFGVTIAMIYLAKSSMAPAVLVLTVAYLLQESRRISRILVLMIAISAPLGWALHQHHATGRYSLGTSLDGINFHKGNNEHFLARYPPPPGGNLDQFDGEFNAGHFFLNEWQFSDFHKAAAEQYMATHPGATLQADLRKLHVLLFSLQKEGGGKIARGPMAIYEFLGMLIFRGLLWTSLAGAAYRYFRFAGRNAGTQLGWSSVIYVAFVLTAVLPYVVGFGYTRHGSILIYPAALFCCAMLCEEGNKESPMSLPQAAKIGVEAVTP